MSNTPITLTFENTEIVALDDKNGEPVFVAGPIAKKLGHRDAANMLRGLDADEKGTRIVSTPGGSQETSVITLAGLNHALNNRRAGAIKDDETRSMVTRFQRWVNHDVLPTIYRHGVYATETVLQKAVDDPDFMIGVLTRLKKEREQRARAERTIREQAPKVLFADSVETAKSSILIGELARDLRQNGVQIGQNRLFRWMREHGYLIGRKGESWNKPTQRALEQGLFEVKTRTVNKPDGTALITRTTKVTGKGRITFTQKLLGEHPAESQDSSALGRAKG